MILFELTADASIIRPIATHPKLYGRMSDDNSPPPEDWVPLGHLLFLLVREEGELLGMFAFESRNSVTWEVHTVLLPHVWGARSRGIALAMLDWLRANTQVRRLITSVPAFNRLALKFAEDAGLTRFGLDQRSFLKHGKLHDQILLGISLGGGIICP